MAITKNAGSLFLSAASPRLLTAPNATIILSTTTPVFHVDTSGTSNIPSVVVSARLIQLEGNVTFSCVGGTLSSITGSTATLLFTNMSANSATITASITYRDRTLTSSVVIAKVVDGTSGTNSPPQTAAQLKATLTGQITESELFGALQTRISLIDGASSVAGSVNARVAAATASASSDLAAAQSTLNSSIAANGSAIVTLQNTDTTHTSNITALGTRATTSESNITTLQGTTADQATALTSLTTRTTTAESNITSLNTTTSGQATSLTALTTRVGTAESSITSLNTTTANQATSISTLNTTVGNNSSSISTQATTLNGLSAQYTVKVDVNGHVSGFGLASTATNGTPTSSFIVNADSFAVSYPGLSTKIPFAVGNVNGVSTIGFDGTTIIDGSLTIRNAAGTVLFDVGGLKAGAEAPGTLNSDIVVGGRNLYSRTTGIFDIGPASSSLGARSTSGFTLNGIGANTGVMRMANVITKNGQWTVSFDLAMGSPGYPLMIDVCDGAGQTITTISTLQHFSLTFTVGNWSSAVYNFIDFNGLSAQPYVFTNFKVEEGNKATAWTPSPEDVASDATTKADAAQSAAISAAAIAAQTKADLAQTTASAYADGIVTAEEARAIADATTKANAAQAAATSAAAADATAKANAAQAAAIATANTALADKLNKNANDVLGGILSADVVSAPAGFRAGTLTWNAAGTRTGGYGVAITPLGLVGYTSAGVLTFAIDAATGAATFGGALNAPTGTFGAVTIAAGGSLSSGQTAYDTGTGWWQGIVSGVPMASMGIAGGAGWKWTGSAFIIKDPTIVRSTPFAVNNITDATYSFAHSTSLRSFGSYTASSVGGTGTVTYSWSITNSVVPGATCSFVGTSSGASVSIQGSCNLVANVDYYVTVTATDSSGAAATSETFFINVDFT